MTKEAIKVSNSNKNITIADVAQALGVSKTTVSRAISGKGRIGQQTREKVMEYIKEHDYKPNVIAKSLASSKTFNLCVVMPEQYALIDLPFFQEVISGIQESASTEEYDILLCLSDQNNTTSLERIVSNRKVDGVILLRTLLKDAQIELLKKYTIPYVTVGSTNYKDVVQIDNDHKNACKELTSILLTKNIKKIALLGGSEEFIVNQNRLEGFKEGFKEKNVEIDKGLIHMNLDNQSQIEKVITMIMKKKVDCCMCMDDAIATILLRIFKEKKIAIPNDMKVASFYNSSILEDNVPSITSLNFDAKELGKVASDILLKKIEGKTVKSKTLLSYDVVLKDSTK